MVRLSGLFRFQPYCMQHRREESLKEEEETIKMIQGVFGEQSSNHTTVRFTHGNGLRGEMIEEFISLSKILEFTDQCHGGYQVFDRENPNNCSPVTWLLQTVEKMVATNGGCYYKIRCRCLNS